MSIFEKTKQEIMKRPTRKDIRPIDLQNFLNYYGFKLKRVTGDHYIYCYMSSKKEFTISIPMANPVKPAYIDLVRKTIKEIEDDE